MEFNCKVKIVDAIMGAGKSQSIINLINNSDEDDYYKLSGWSKKI